MYLEEMFDVLKDIYPNKNNIHYAWKSFKKLKPSLDLFEDMCEHIEKQKATEQWTKQDGRFIPQLITYLEGKRWEDGGIVIEKPKRICDNCGCEIDKGHQVGSQVFCSRKCRKEMLGW